MSDPITSIIFMALSSSMAALIFMFLVRGVQFNGPNTDNELMAYAAATSSRWRWFSDLHKMGLGKTGMKDMTIILMAVFQKIFRNKTGDYPYTALGGISTAFSSFLIFLIALGYWNPAIALFLGILFLTSLWSWQVALYGGHANVATMLFLLSVLFIQQANGGWPESAIWLIGAGIIFCFAQFASASTIKYTPLFFTAVFYSSHRTIIANNAFDNIYTQIWNNQLVLFNMTMLILYGLTIVFLWLVHKKIVASIYYQTAPRFLNKLIRGRDKFSLDFYLEHARKRVKQLTVWGLYATVALLLLVNLISWGYLLLILIGFIIGFLTLTLPDIKKSFKYFFAFLLETQIRKKSHFRLYVDYFAKKGLTVTRYTQGAGLIWLPKVFFRMVPVHTIIFTASAIGLIVSPFFLQGNLIFNEVGMVLILLFSLSPVIWAEITKAPQLSRTYSPGLVGIFLAIGSGAYLIQLFFYDKSVPIFIVLILVALVWNLWKFFSDVYPARMSVTNLINTLDRLGIKEFYTYNTNYNKSFIEAIHGIGKSDYLPPKDMAPPYIVHYINSIADVKNGWIVIPCTSSKSLYMNTEMEAIEGGDYTKDPVLNKLLETRDMEKIATAKFKTMGTSNIWPVESEVTGFRDLILHEITKKDRWRGYAWLLNTRNLEN